MEVRGQGKKGILIIGEFPTSKDDKRGRYYTGYEGSFLWDAEKELGIDIEKDCYIINAVRCHPYGSFKDKKKLIPKATEACRHMLHATIKELAPEVIIPLGEVAVDGLIGDKISGRLSGTAKSAFFGHTIPDQDLQSWVCPTYSPAYLDAQFKPKDHYRIFLEHLEAAVRCVGVPLPRPYHKTKITKDEAEARQWLLNAKEAMSKVAYDYETTGIKPNRDGHRIVCASIAFDGVGYAFPFFDTNSWRQAWKNFLTDDSIKKVAHNLGFEAIWTKVRAGLDYWPSDHAWDTCLGAHCLNNQAPTSLKFQIYVNKGVIGFDDAVDAFITKPKKGQDPKNKNSFNKIDECPMTVLLKYNAFDSLYTLDLEETQSKEMIPHIMKGFKLFMRGAEALARIQNNGMLVDPIQIVKNMDKLKSKMDAVEEAIRELDEVQEYNPMLDLASSTQLSSFFYDHLHIKIPPEGRKVDEKVLSRFDHPAAKLILKYRKASKLRDTFLHGFQREQVDGIIHPSFNLNRVKTFRSSSSDPNFQNIPKHNKQANLYVRGTIKPKPGCKIVEYDYRGIEVAVGCTLHKDPTMIKYLEDPSNNMHTDTACDLFFREKDTFLKSERQLAKNKMVFPEFYGSTAVPKKEEKFGVIVRDLWEGASRETISHLDDSGIRNIKDFQAHVTEVERKMWEERFPVFNEWRRKEYNRYLRQGYLDTYTGFRVYGPIRFTQAINICTQGSAFHVLLYAMCASYQRIEDISGRSFTMGQVHDAMVNNVHPEDEVEVDSLVNYYSTKRAVEVYPELESVPLILEKDSSEVDGDWADMHEVGPMS